MPGTPESLGEAIFDESSPTFHEGRIGSSRQKMSSEAIEKFFSLDQDFMHLTGYADKQIDGSKADLIWDSINTIPSRVEEFRTRPLRTSNETFGETPFPVEWDYLGHNIVRFDNRYFGLSRSAGPVDLIGMRSRGELSRLPSSDDLESLKAELVMKRGTPIEKCMPPIRDSATLPKLYRWIKEKIN